MNERYTAYLKTDEWREISRLCRERAGNRCQVCNSPQKLQAHHRTYEHFGREREHLGDLTCLCADCHSFYHKAIQPGKAATKLKYFTDCQRAADKRRLREKKKWRAVKEKRRNGPKPQRETDPLDDALRGIMDEA